MSTLIVYPTARAIREASAARRREEGLLPRLMRMDEFLTRLARVPGRSMIQGSQRIFRLREAAEFSAFERLMKIRGLIRFFSRSDDFFRFFEELAWEQVALERLAEADAYAEYGEHLEILKELRRRYRAVLEAEGLYDRMFLPDLYHFNDAFVRRFERVELHLEGYLSRFEMELLSQVAEATELVVYWRTTPYNEKMRQRFAELGIAVPSRSRVCLDWTRKRLREERREALNISARVFALEERYEQVALALAEIEGMVRRGIAPERIALVLPREEFKYAFMLYDRMGNLNFSMGFDLRERPEYRIPAGLLEWWSGRKDREREWLERLGAQRLLELSAGEKCDAEGFFARMESAELPGFSGSSPEGAGGREEEALRELRSRFGRLHWGRILPLREWLFLWLRELEELRLDDIRGGKVTVMGVLETRGVAFDGVVIVDFNDGIVPAPTGKDRFLDSRVRHFAGLPDRQDREALQKHYYARLLEETREAVILYARGDHRLPSRFLYELELGEGEPRRAPRELLYRRETLSPRREEPVVEGFDPSGMLWSASRLASWLECRRKFYYRYIAGLPEKKSDAINEGSVLHKILEELYRDREAFDDAETMRRELERVTARILKSEELKGLYLGRYWRWKLEGFVEGEIRHFAEGWRVAARELTVEGDIAGLRFAGRIDRLDRRGGETMALDYKSGSVKSAQRMKNLEKLTDFQMSIYRILLRRDYPGLSLAYVPILEGGGYEAPTVPEEKEALLLEHLEALRNTTRFTAEKTPELSACQYCPYQLLCERGEYL